MVNVISEKLPVASSLAPVVVNCCNRYYRYWSSFSIRRGSCISGNEGKIDQWVVRYGEGIVSLFNGNVVDV